MNGIRDVIGTDWDTKKYRGTVLDNIVIRFKHIENALKNVKPSCVNLDSKYNAWFEQFGAC